MPSFNIGFHYAEGMYLTITAENKDEASYIANLILERILRQHRRNTFYETR